MSNPDSVVPDLDARFDEEYVHFTSMVQTPEQNDRDTDLVVRVGEITPGMDVLDVPCGWGRIANRLAARGCRVAGLDASRLYLDRARRDALEMGVAVEYVEGDMRDLPWTERFDRLACWYNSLGYFDDETNRRVLAGFRRALRPGGRLLIEHVNLLALARELPAGPASSATTGTHMFFLADRGEEFFIYRMSLNGLTSRVEYERVVSRGGRISRHSFSQRAFTAPELRDWLLQAGFARAEVYGADGGPLRLAGRMLVVAHV
jgi:SAM-dependent methyltransferase